MLTQVLVDAGFTDVNTDTVTHEVQFADGSLFARLNAMALIGMSDSGKAMSEAERGELAGQIAVESYELIARNMQEGMFALPLASILAVAHL